MKKWIRLIEKLLLYGLFALGVVLLFYGTGRISTMLLAFESFFAAILIAWIFHQKGLNEKYLPYFYLGLWFNMFGEIIAYYNGTFLYDKLLHLSLGILLSAVILEYYEKNSDLKRDSTFFAVLGLLAIWEIYEFALDSFFGFQAQGVFINNIMVQSAINDTMYDLIWGSIGSLVYLFFKKEHVDVTIKRDVKKTEMSFSTFLKNHLKW